MATKNVATTLNAAVLAAEKALIIETTFKKIIDHPHSYIVKDLVSTIPFSRSLIKSEIDPITEQLILVLFSIHGKEGLQKIYARYFPNLTDEEREKDKPKKRLNDFTDFLKAQGEKLIEYMPAPIPAGASRGKIKQIKKSNYALSLRLKEMGHTPKSWQILVDNYKKTYNKFCEQCGDGYNQSIEKREENGTLVYQTVNKSNVNDSKKIKRSVKGKINFLGKVLSFSMALGQAVMNVVAIILIFTNPMIGIPVALLMGGATLATNYFLVNEGNAKNLMKFIGMPIILLMAQFNKKVTPQEKQALKNEFFHGLAANLTKGVKSKGELALYIAVAVVFAGLGVISAAVFGVGAFMATLTLPATFTFIPAIVAVIIGAWLGIASAISLGGLMYCSLVETAQMLKKIKESWADYNIELNHAQTTRARKYEMRLSTFIMPFLWAAVIAMAMLGTIATMGALYGPMVSFMTTYLAATPAMASAISLAMVYGVTTITSLIFSSNSSYLVLGFISDAISKGITRVADAVVGLFYPDPAQQKMITTPRKPIFSWDNLKETFSYFSGVNLIFTLKTAAIKLFYAGMFGLVIVNAVATGIFSGAGAAAITRVLTKLKLVLTSGQALAAAVVPGSVISAGANAGPVYDKYLQEPSYYNGKLTSTMQPILDMLNVVPEVPEKLIARRNSMSDLPTKETSKKEREPIKNEGIAESNAFGNVLSSPREARRQRSQSYPLEEKVGKLQKVQTNSIRLTAGGQ